MPRVVIGPALPDRASLDNEIARLRDLDVGELRSRWHNVFGRRPHPHLPRHLLFRVLAHRLQADVLGDLDGESQRLLDRSVSPEDAGQRAVDLARRTANLRPGTALAREWNSQMFSAAAISNSILKRKKMFWNERSGMAKNSSDPVITMMTNPAMPAAAMKSSLCSGESEIASDCPSSAGGKMR